MQTSTRVKDRSPGLRMKPAGWHRHCERLGIETETELAEMLGTSTTTLYRIRRHMNAPSADFIAGALAAFPAARFEDLFEVVKPSEHAA
jgi:hypothetical protein